MLYTHPIKNLNRLANRTKREIIARVPPVHWAAERLHQRRRRQWAANLPVLHDRAADLVAGLEREAIVIGTLEGFQIPGTTALKSALDHLVEPLRLRSVQEASTVRPSQDELTDDLSLWHWGLQDSLLDIVENYLGVAPRYYGPDVRREIADSQATGVRQWHRDIEDRRMVKVLVWLNDVGALGGPYAYLPASRSEEVVPALGYVSGFVSDDRLSTMVPMAEIRTVPGPKWTAFMADNTRLLHRATPPVAQDRYSVTFTWSTRHPRRTIEPVPWTTAQAARIRSGLTERQLVCLPRQLQSLGS